MLSESYTDNPRNTPNTLSDSITHFSSGTAISVDTVRLQGQLSTSLDYYKYARATELDTLNANLLGYGLGTVVRDHVFVDGRAAITQLSNSGGVGFTNSTVIPPSQQTQAGIISLSPIVRESIGDFVDGEFRYNYGLSLFQNGSLLSNSTTTVPPSTTVPSASPLSNTTTNNPTLTLATGRRFTFLSSKLTLDANQTDSQSAAKSTQLRGYDDLEYQVSRQFAALARFGYEDLRYPLQPGASTRGVIWLIGGRLTPFPDSNLTVHYGRQDGFNHADGTLRYQVTPATSIRASLQQSRSSAQQQLLANLNLSQQDINGTIVNRNTGLPVSLTNTGFAATSNNIFRTENINMGIQTALDRDTFGIFGFLDQRSSATPTSVTGTAATASGNGTSIGANLNWSRSLTPDLTSRATLGYVVEQSAHQKTLTADWQLTYTLSRTLTGVLHYQFINVAGAIVGASAFASASAFAGASPIASGPYRRNQLEISVTRSF